MTAGDPVPAGNCPPGNKRGYRRGLKALQRARNVEKTGKRYTGRKHAGKYRNTPENYRKNRIHFRAYGYPLRC